MKKTKAVNEDTIQLEMQRDIDGRLNELKYRFNNSSPHDRDELLVSEDARVRKYLYGRRSDGDELGPTSSGDGFQYWKGGNHQFIQTYVYQVVSKGTMWLSKESDGNESRRHEIIEAHALYEYLEWLQSLPRQSVNIRHRVKALVHNYKVDAGLEERMARKDIKPKNFEIAFDTLNPMTSSKSNPYRSPTLAELEQVLDLLSDYPEAMRLCRIDYEKLTRA